MIGGAMKGIPAKHPFAMADLVASANAQLR
jgi:hypothetical protein